MAKRLLMSKLIQLTGHNVTLYPSKRVEMQSRSKGGRTVPQIFIDKIHIGGSDDLAALERAGKLDEMLGLS